MVFWVLTKQIKEGQHTWFKKFDMQFYHDIDRILHHSVVWYAFFMAMRGPQHEEIAYKIWNL